MVYLPPICIAFISSLRIKMAKASSVKNIRALTYKQVARSIGPAALRRARAEFETIKRETLTEFNAHAITREIEGGPSASNISGTLGGKGNLFSFIGFDSGASPTEPIRRLIMKSYVSMAPPLSGVVYFNFFLPDMEEIYLNTPMPWAAGRSWARGIEVGMSGLGQYTYSRRGISKSRSGTAIQSEKKVSGAKYRPTKYMSSILLRAKTKLERLVI